MNSLEDNDIDTRPVLQEVEHTGEKKWTQVAITEELSHQSFIFIVFLGWVFCVFALAVYLFAARNNILFKEKISKTLLITSPPLQ